MSHDIFNLSQFLPYKLAVLSERVSKRLSLCYGEQFGLTTAEWRVMVHLSRCHTVSVREIHNCVNLEKPRVSRAVKKVENSGLVEKTGSEQDHRLVKISLTPEGYAVLEKLLPLVTRIEADILARFSPEELTQLSSIMEKLHQILDADPAAPKRSMLDQF